MIACGMRQTIPAWSVLSWRMANDSGGRPAPTGGGQAAARRRSVARDSDAGILGKVRSTSADGRSTDDPDLARVENALLTRWPESRLEPSLTRISALVDLLGSPQRAMPVVHVAGTN